MSDTPLHTDVTFDEGDNLGGVLSIRYAPTSTINTLTQHTHFVAPDSTSFNAGNGWRTLRLVEDTADWSENHRPPGRQPERYDYNFRGELAGDTAIAKRVLGSAAKVPIIAEVLDNNMNRRRLGTMNNPAWLSYSHTTGRGMAARNGYVITIEWSARETAPFVGAGNFGSADPEGPGGDPEEAG
jgi:hypothetical protein